MLSLLLSLWSSDLSFSDFFSLRELGDERSLLRESESCLIDQSGTMQTAPPNDQSSAIQGTPPNCQLTKTPGEAGTSAKPARESQSEKSETTVLDAAATAQISLSSADERLLCTVPGIGPVTARAILRRREELGGKMRVEDLLSVPGIKEKKFARFKPYFRP